MNRFIRFAATSAVLAGAVLLTGCAQMQMGQPKPTMDNTVKLRAAAIAPVAVGAFKADAAKPDLDKGVGVRGGNKLASPVEGSFAKYLAETLKVELQAAGLLDAASGTVVSGTLTRSELDPAMSTGTGALGARFVVTRNGAVNYDRELKVDSSWESSFIGAVAIPAAAANYEGLYRKLVGVLFDDAEFRKAVAK
jgi:hypothetical protein